MTSQPIWIAAVLLLGQALAIGQQADPTAPRSINLPEAVALALKHNHVVRIASLHVDEEQHVKDVARSQYFPVLRNDTSYFHMTDTQLIQIPAGSLGDGIPTK